MNSNKLNKSETKVLQCIRDKQPIPCDKKGKYNIYYHRAITALVSRKLINLCNEKGRDEWCISDPERVQKLLEDIAPGVCPG